MTRVIEDGFSDFGLAILPRQAAGNESYLSKIEDCLAPHFEQLSLVSIGSLKNGTGIVKYSKRDLLLKSPALSDVTDLEVAVRRLPEMLETVFTGVTSRDSAVSVPVDVAAGKYVVIYPAAYADRSKEGHEVYKILDRNNGSRSTSPDAHDSYLSSLDLRLDGRVRPLIRFIKAWKYYRRVPISSFYLDAHVMRYSASMNVTAYSSAMLDILSSVMHSGLVCVEDPSGVVEDIYATTGPEVNLEEVFEKLALARSRAERACEAERDSDIDRAFHWWDVLFDGEFPSYYKLADFVRSNC